MTIGGRFPGARRRLCFRCSTETAIAIAWATASAMPVVAVPVAAAENLFLVLDKRDYHLRLPGRLG